MLIRLRWRSTYVVLSRSGPSDGAKDWVFRPDLIESSLAKDGRCVANCATGSATLNCGTTAGVPGCFGWTQTTMFCSSCSPLMAVVMVNSSPSSEESFCWLRRGDRRWGCPCCSGWMEESMGWARFLAFWAGSGPAGSRWAILAHPKDWNACAFWAFNWAVRLLFRTLKSTYLVWGWLDRRSRAHSTI
ncbi:hypothetical protein RchiOBHm_Chr5g0036761 [Rosa chinensis]|uniref:Uncharacterized protein n=1 Tax=Rosa chinensis TaxID=74649 RepID=A0A2P6QBJ9_ROSCH|nr:hypothetical protein RchiOBHm_Chr5g0036761 [Rosa chinensis]